MKLDSDALLASIKVVGVPKPDREWTWRMLLLMCEVNYHGVSDVPHACFDHGVTDDVEWVATCDDCVRTLGEAD